MTRELAQRLRPELEAAVAANDAGARWCRRRAWGCSCVAAAAAAAGLGPSSTCCACCPPTPSPPRLPPAPVPPAAAPGEPYEFSAAACARRALKNKALGYLANLGEPAVTEQLLRRAREATNMTDEISALAALDRAGARGGVWGRLRSAPRLRCAAACPSPPRAAPTHARARRLPSTAGGLVGASPGCVEARATALAGFYDKWQAEPLVLFKWFALQVGSTGGLAWWGLVRARGAWGLASRWWLRWRLGCVLRVQACCAALHPPRPRP